MGGGALMMGEQSAVTVGGGLLAMMRPGRRSQLCAMVWRGLKGLLAMNMFATIRGQSMSAKRRRVQERARRFSGCRYSGLIQPRG